MMGSLQQPEQHIFVPSQLCPSKHVSLQVLGGLPDGQLPLKSILI